MQEREKIKLSNSQWRDLVQEDYLEIDGQKIEIENIKDEYCSTGRHTESHYKIFKRLIDDKFFKIYYQISVKDEMGWSECNYGTTEALEVFPETTTIIVYK